jgi:hypothetical protein
MSDQIKERAGALRKSIAWHPVQGGIRLRRERPHDFLPVFFVFIVFLVRSTFSGLPPEGLRAGVSGKRTTVPLPSRLIKTIIRFFSPDGQQKFDLLNVGYADRKRGERRGVRAESMARIFRMQGSFLDEPMTGGRRIVMVPVTPDRERVRSTDGSLVPGAVA